MRRMFTKARSFQTIGLFTLLLLTQIPAFADVTVAQAQQIATEIVNDPEVILTSQGEKVKGIINCYHFTGPKDEHLTIDINKSSGDLIYFSWVSKRFEDSAKLIDATKADTLLSGILHKFVSQNNQKGLVKIKTKLIDHGGSGKEYLQEWIKVISGVNFPFEVRISINAMTGKMTMFQLINQEKNIPNLTPKITEEVAVSKAAPYVNKILMDGWKNVANQLQIAFPIENQALQWTTVFLGYKLKPYIPARGQEAVHTAVYVIIDATTGAFVRERSITDPSSKSIMIKPPIPQPTALTTADYWPQWSASGNSILFYIWRELQEDFPRETLSQPRMKGDTSGYKSIMAKVDGGKVTALIWTPQRSNHPTWSPNEKRIAFEGWISGPLYDLEIAMPMLRPMGDSQRFDFEMPCWDPLGKDIVYSRSSIDDNVGHDIMVSKVIDLPVGYYASVKNSWLAKIPGDDILPVFSPNGKNVIFAHEQSNPTSTDYLKIRYTLYIVAANQAVGDENYIPPRLISNDIPTPTRISWFPDGQKVLLSYQNGDWYDKTQNNIYPPEIVDITTGKRKLLGWPALYDPDLPTGFPLVTEELTVNPSGDRVAFSAIRWSGNPKDKGARVIYSCKLDGSDLRRETPYDLRESDMLMYQYPKANVDARNAFEELLVTIPKTKPISP